MEKASKYFSFLKYSITHPKNGVEILQNAIEVKQNQSKELQTLPESYASAEEVFNYFFPNSEISFANLKDETIEIQNKLKKFFKELESKEFPTKEKPYDIGYSVDDQLALFYYAVCRTIKPKIVVETGVAYGHSSSYILEAMKRNNFGELYSIDYVFSPWQTKEKIGSAIPNELKNRWSLEFGTSSKKLKNLLKNLGEIDIFIHDSLHTYQNMKFEFETAWPRIKNGGFMLSDDVSANYAFSEFSKKYDIDPKYISPATKDSKFFGGAIQKKVF